MLLIVLVMLSEPLLCHVMRHASVAKVLMSALAAGFGTG